MHLLSIVKDFKFADCGRMTGYSEVNRYDRITSNSQTNQDLAEHVIELLAFSEQRNGVFQFLAAASHRGNRGICSRMRCRFLDLPTPDQEPKHEEQFPEEGDKEESKMNVRKKIRPQAIDHPTQSINY